MAIITNPAHTHTHTHTHTEFHSFKPFLLFVTSFLLTFH